MFEAAKQELGPTRPRSLGLALALAVAVVPAAATEAPAPCPLSTLHVGTLLMDVPPLPSEPPTAGARAEPLGEAVVTELISWIGENSDYDVSAALSAPPEVTFCTPGETLEYEDERLVVERHFRGIYDKRRRTIHLVEPWDRTDPLNVSTLLHELIHDVQWHEAEWACAQESEWEAYKLQEAYLAERGIDAQFDWLTIFLVSRCPDDVHP